MATRNTKDRFKYGICLNDECPKCKNKEVQQIPMRKELVCSECGKELRECPPPKKKNFLPLILAIVGILLAAGVVCFFAFSGGGSEEQKPEVTDTVPAVDTTKVVTPEVKPDTIVRTDTVVVRDTIVQNNPVTPKPAASTSAPAQPKASSGSLSLSYGKYTGATKGGYPHGQGRLTYNKTRQINRNDTKGRTANAGDYVIGEFFNGFVVYGKHYDADGNLLESLNFGVGSEDSYESK